ncbi:MAG TPA: FHA domain-containing protein [Blastocatellia bacterium]|nr:FHA domain-containing protein [Blastocatellia bacterium]
MFVAKKVVIDSVTPRRIAFIAGLAVLVGAWASSIPPGRVVKADAPEASAIAEQPMTGERMALYAKPSVVRVLDGVVAKILFTGNGKTYTVVYGGSGSGSFISSDGYIMTNAHVVAATQLSESDAKQRLLAEFIKQLAVDLNVRPESLVNDPTQLSAILDQAQFEGMQPIRKVVVADGSVFPFEVQQFGTPITDKSSKDVAIIKIAVTNAPILKLGDSDAVKDEDHVSVVGYPSAQSSEFLSDTSDQESSITDGKISARRMANDNLPILQTTAPATHGNSGGPVLDDKGEIVGLLTFGGGRPGEQEVSGFAFIVPTSTAMAFVREEGVRNEEGPVDAAYRAGLDDYFARHYSAAMTKFQEVKRLFPHHSKVAWLLADCSKQIAAGHEAIASVVVEKKGLPTTALILGGGGLALIVVIVVAAVLMKGGRKASAGQAGQAAAPAMAPKVVLRGVSGFYAGNEVGLDERPLFIGRDPAVCQLVFPASVERISGRHCMVRYDRSSNSVVLDDCQSTNGTFLQSGQQVKAGTPWRLRPNERFYLSDPENMFEVAVVAGGGPAGAPGPGVSPTKPIAALAPMLVGIQGQYAGRRIDLGPEPTVMGRDPAGCRVVFPPSVDGISKRHCMLRFDPSNGSFVLEDLGSTNGTFVMAGGVGQPVAPGRPRQIGPSSQFYLSGPENLFEVRLEPR